jgi:hypothetical protein
MHSALPVRRGRGSTAQIAISQLTVAGSGLVAMRATSGGSFMSIEQVEQFIGHAVINGFGVGLVIGFLLWVLLVFMGKRR